MVAVAEARASSFVCANCGHADVGKYCSNCGAPNGKAANRAVAIKSLVGAPYEYVALIVGVLRSASFAQKIRSRQIGILNALVFASIAVALVSLLRPLFGVSSFGAALTGAPTAWLADPVKAGLAELGAFLLAAFGFWLMLYPSHRMLKKDGDIAARWTNIFVANTCIYAIAYPIFFLGALPLIESDPGSAWLPGLIGAFFATAGVLMLRVYKHLYGRSYVVTVASLLLFLMIVFAVALFGAVSLLFLFPGSSPIL